MKKSLGKECVFNFVGKACVDKKSSFSSTSSKAEHGWRS